MCEGAEAIHLTERLQRKIFRYNECLAAIRGEAIPQSLGLEVVRLCTIRGIRYHPSFGEELHGILPEFTRALNARKIMSNDIPTMLSASDFPYCIWHPDPASEDTYRKLAQRYPSMAYQVGRACAVAGYHELFKELSILPEVHIAEEARECGQAKIYQDIMANAVIYNVMDDYTRSIDLANPTPARLNGDTAAYRSLNVKQAFAHADEPEVTEEEDFYGLFGDPGFKETTFNITEDRSIDEHSAVSETKTELEYDVTDLLCEPLPRDLPTLNKDLLILMAAYYGNVDRYVRLRRPKMIQNELACCVRGVFHNTMFALWWSRQPGDTILPTLRKAINARFIMNNVLSAFPLADRNAIPYLIWYPTVAHESTYRELAKREPSMKPQIVRACIAADYSDLFQELLDSVVPDDALRKEAAKSANQVYTQLLGRRIEVVGKKELPASERWKLQTTSALKASNLSISDHLSADLVGTDFDMLYEGKGCDIEQIETFVCLPDHWRKREVDYESLVEMNYVDWPPSNH